VSQELEVGLGAASLVLVSLKQGGGGDEAGYGGVGKMANCSYWNQLLLSGCRLVARRIRHTEVPLSPLTASGQSALRVQTSC